MWNKPSEEELIKIPAFYATENTDCPDKIIQDYSESGAGFGDYIDGDENVLAGAALLSVFRNIIKNAEIHSNTTKLEISIRKISGKCETYISDFGTGIPESDYKRIFEEGFSDGSNAGSGLGLFIAQKITENYNGEILVRPNSPSGTTFIISLPCA